MRVDFNLSTSKMYTHREFTEVAFNEFGIELEWQGENERIDAKSFDGNKLSSVIPDPDPESKNYQTFQSFSHTIQHGSIVVSIDPSYFRPLVRL